MDIQMLCAKLNRYEGIMALNAVTTPTAIAAFEGPSICAYHQRCGNYWSALAGVRFLFRAPSSTG